MPQLPQARKLTSTNFNRGLDTVTKQCKAHELTLVIGDFNAKVGNTETPGVTGKFGLGDKNERGKKLVEWAEVNNMMVRNTLFQHHPRRLWTWESPGNRTRNQIDYIIIYKRYKSALLSPNTRPEARGISDHDPVVSKLKIKIKNLQRSKRSASLNIEMLNSWN
jgi:endonuclease/exonuclease/phosphatase family metal-dependent hydrolase